MVFKLIDGGMGTNLRKLEWNDIPVKAPFKIENKVHDLFASCDIITTNTFAIDAGYHVSE
ncbi:hypothetical protein FACS189459_0450 [Bacilli bacterium]|nr:hypothetical protein FACS189459_0450 [Bacilli bacterium]